MTDVFGFSVLIAAVLCATSLLFGFPIGRGRGIKVFGAAMLLAFVLFAAVFDDFDSGVLAFRNGDWPGAIAALERIEPESERHDSAQVLLRIARQRRESEAGRDTLPVAAADPGPVPAAEPPAPHAAAEAEERVRPAASYSLSNDGAEVYVSSSRDWWDDAHLRAVVAPGTGAILLEEERIEDVPGFVLNRCRVRTTTGKRVTGWIFCDDLHPK